MNRHKVLTLWNGEQLNEQDTRILRTPCSEMPVPFDAETRQAIRTLAEAFLERDDAVGLAAPQIGIMLRLAVVDASDKRGQAVRMANPEILHASVQMRSHDEASPNIPGISAIIERPRAVTVRFLNDQGEIVDRDFVGLWATSVQHQIDHLNGRTYLDHLSPLRRKMLVQKAKKLQR